MDIFSKKQEGQERHQVVEAASEISAARGEEHYSLSFELTFWFLALVTLVHNRDLDFCGYRLDSKCGPLASEGGIGETERGVSLCLLRCFV
jgi:hypothetical protein